MSKKDHSEFPIQDQGPQRRTTGISKEQGARRITVRERIPAEAEYPLSLSHRRGSFFAHLILSRVPPFPLPRLLTPMTLRPQTPELVSQPASLGYIKIHVYSGVKPSHATRRQFTSKCGSIARCSVLGKGGRGANFHQDQRCSKRKFTCVHAVTNTIFPCCK